MNQGISGRVVKARVVGMTKKEFLADYLAERERKGISTDLHEIVEEQRMLNPEYAEQLQKLFFEDW